MANAATTKGAKVEPPRIHGNISSVGWVTVQKYSAYMNGRHIRNPIIRMWFLFMSHSI
jgi:hypothetical protein